MILLTYRQGFGLEQIPNTTEQNIYLSQANDVRSIDNVIPATWYSKVQCFKGTVGRLIPENIRNRILNFHSSL